MSELAATQIPKPIDEAAFERANEVLWRCILKDENTQLYGRRGQRQYGVDIVGRREGSSDRIVGIQCKLKGEGKTLDKEEVRREVAKALKFNPPLSEYIVVTTAPDDAALHSLALELSQSVYNESGKRLEIRVMGWGSLEREIRRYPKALKAFVPRHQTDNTEQMLVNMPRDTLAVLAPEFNTIKDTLRQINSAVSDPAIHFEHERQVDLYAGLIRTDPKTALKLLRKLRDVLGSDAHRTTKFRVAANIAFCHLALGDDQAASRDLVAAWDYDADNPKASACKAFGLLLQEDWAGLRRFAEARLRSEPNNAELAAFYVHSLIGDTSISDPLHQVPCAVRSAPEVSEAYIRWLMERGEHGTWWDVAIRAHEAHADSYRLQEMFACALLERVIDDRITAESRSLSEVERTEVRKSIAIYEAHWRQVCDSSGHLRAESITVPVNLMSAYRLLDQGAAAVRTGKEAVQRFPDDVKAKEHLALAMAELGETTEILSLISGLPDSPHIAVIRYNIAIGNEDWPEIL